jgi:hypothetical protein
MLFQGNIKAQGIRQGWPAALPSIGAALIFSFNLSPCGLDHSSLPALG